MSRGNTILSMFTVIALSVLGVILARSIPDAVFPEFVFHRAIILADNAALPAGQMLIAVTRPLEEAAYNVAGTTLVRSTTTRGSTEVDVNFAESNDPTTSFELLGAALAEVRANLPPGTTVDTRLLSTGTFPILDLSLSSRDAQPGRAYRRRDLRPGAESSSHSGRLPGRNGRREVPRVRGAAGPGADARARTHSRPDRDAGCRKPT